MNRPLDYTVDFIIQFEDGTYWCRPKINKRYRGNHFNAISCDTRKSAEFILEKRFRSKGKICKRSCSLEDC